MIISHHYAVHGGFSFPAEAVTLNRLWTQFLWMGGKIGVNLFVLISGYFLIGAPKIKTQKVLKLWLQIVTYAAVLFALFIAAGLETFGWRKLEHTLLPISFTQWWFASTYFILYLLSPFLNKLLHALTRRDYQKLLVLLGMCWCVIPTILNVSLESSNLAWFAFLYAAAGYLRLHGNSRLSCRACLLLGAGMLLFIFLSSAAFAVLGTRREAFTRFITYFYGQQRLPAFLASLFLFLGFQKLNIRPSRAVNLVSSATFGVYLIHDSNYVRPFLWKTLFQNAAYAESPRLIPHSIAAIGLVFACCTLIELARIYLLERNYMGLVSKLSAAIDRQKERLFDSPLFKRL